MNYFLQALACSLRKCTLMPERGKIHPIESGPSIQVSFSARISNAGIRTKSKKCCYFKTV